MYKLFNLVVFVFLFSIFCIPTTTFAGAFAPGGEFGSTTYASDITSSFDVVLEGFGLPNVGTMDFLLEYNPQYLTFDSFVPSAFMSEDIFFEPFISTTTIDGTHEQLRISIASNVPISGEGEFGTTTFTTNSNEGVTNISILEVTMIDFDDFELVTNGWLGEDAVVTIEASDVTSPLRSALAPSGELARGTTATNLTLTTDEDAFCHYATVAQTTYEDGTPFTTTGGTSHTTPIAGLSNGSNYTYYVRCSDGLGNVHSDDAVITFSVQANAVTSSGSGGGSGGGSSSSKDTSAPRSTSIKINKDAVSTTDPKVSLALTARDENKTILMQISESKSFTKAEWLPFSQTSSWTFTQGNGIRTIYARFKDGKGNTSEAVSDSITLNVAGDPAVTVTPKPSTAPSTQVTTSTFTFQRNLGLGTSGNDVIELQKRLRAEGFFTYPTNTGYFGQATAEAVKLYQKKYLIDTTGFVGPLTMQKLNSTHTQSQNDPNELSLEGIIRLFLALGIIPQDKAEIAFSALENL